MPSLRLPLFAALVSAAFLAGCAGVGAGLGGPPLVSAQFPPGTGSVNVNSQPQPVNSLPPGAANSTPAVPTSYQPSYFALTFGPR